MQIPGLGFVRVATVAQRLLARLIDTSIYIGVFVILAIIEYAVSPTTFTDDYGNTFHATSGIAEEFGVLPAVVVTMIVGLVYEWLMIARRGATLGKMAIHLKVVNETTGSLVDLGNAFVRQLIPFAGGLLCILPALLIYLSVVFDNSGRLQGWHDKAANDLVIQT